LAWTVSPHHGQKRLHSFGMSASLICESTSMSRQ